MTRYGVEVSQGQDTEEASPKDLLYSSDYQSPKLNRVFKGTYKTDANGNATIDIAHGLLYAPMVLAYYKLKGGNWTALDNDKIGLLTGRTKVTIKTDYNVNPGENLIPANTEFEYKFWVFRDPVDIL